MWNALRSIVIGSIAVASSFAASAQTLPVTSAGYTPGSFAVSPTGQATYSIPLWAPPGTNGIEPKLSLAYSSNNRASGWISPGWALAGLSQITRCQKTIESDGAVKPVYLAKDDAYCLDGVRLESYTGVYGDPGSTYRTRIERYSLVTAKETAGNGPAWFEVRTKDGLIYEYGGTANARALLPGGTTPYLWSLSKIRDRQGNNLIVDYVSSSGALSPSTIQYTQSPAVGASYPYTIVFGYVSRDADDTLTGYIAGSQFSINRRLTSIDVRYGGTTGTLLRQYRLGYTDSPTTQHSRLAFVQECAGTAGTDCLAATTINYQNGQNGIAAPTAAVGGTLPVYSELRIADISGDGRSDLIYSTGPNNGSYAWFVSLASASGFLPPIDTGIRIGTADNRSELLIGDFLGIGRVQLLAPGGDNHDIWCAWYFEEGFPYAGNCSGVQIDPLTIGGTGPGNEDAPSYAAADVNGDGRSDLIWASTAALGNLPTVYVRLSISVNQSLSFGLATGAYPIPDSFAGLYGSYGPATAATPADRMDFNGDSREDVVLITGKSNQIQIVFTARQLVAGDGAFSTGPTLNDYFGWPQALHWNDDACTDMQFGSTIYLSACNGAFGQSVAAPNGHVRLDWNSDGRADVLYPSGSFWAVRLSQGAQASAEISTGISASLGMTPLDYDADGLVDVMSVNPSTRAISIGLHLGAGMPADLMSSVVDGHGNSFSPTYKPITQSNYSMYGQAAQYPRIARMTPLYVVDQFSASDGTGGTYTNQFYYWGARWHGQGLGFLGFESKRTLDSRTGLYRSEVYSQDFPTVGWLKAEVVQQSDNKIVQRTINTLASTSNPLNENLPISQWRYSYFPYIQRSVTDTYEVGGPRNGALISTRDVTNSFDAWGTQISQTVKTTEGATGLYGGAEYTEIFTASDVQNDITGWCLNKVRRVQHTRRHSLTGGTDVTRTMAYTWDLTNCRLTQQIVEPDSTRWAVTTDYGYDAVGNVDEMIVTPAAGQGQSVRTHAISWGTDGRFPRTFTNPKSQVTSFAWDEAKGVRTSVTDANNLITTTGYDNFNRVIRELRPDGTATDISRHVCSPTYVYCASADVRTYLQAVTKDTASNVIRTDIQSFDGMDRTRYRLGNLLTGAMRGEITTYNSRGLVSAVSMPFIQGEPVWYTSIAYDALSRVSTIQRPISEANPSTHLTQLSYEGLSTVETDALSRSTTRWANAAGDIVRVVDAANGAINYEYDAFGGLLKVRDPAGNESTMTYNVRGMKMASNDVDAGTWTYDYYPLGELKSQTDAKSQTTTFTYDALSRLLTRVDGDGTTQFTYDTSPNGVGQRATASSPGGYSEAYSYDARGRLSQARITADSNTYQYDYGYNPNTGLLEYMTYPTSSSGFRFKLRYDYQYGLMQKVSNYTGDVLGEKYWEGVATNARGQYIDEQLGNGLRTISGYDRIAGWLDDRTTARTGGSSLQNFTYQWDALGNLKQRQDSYNNVTESFYYDSLDRLDYSTLNGTTNLDLAYDAIGNITSKSGVGSYTYHPTKRHAVASTTGTINNSYTYDANGSIATRNGQPITWYRNNLPKKISASATVSSEFWYGPDGARWKQVTVNGSSTGTWTYIGGFVERLVTSNVNEFRHYIQGPNGVVAVYKRPASGTSPTTTYLTTDHLGSLDVIANTAGIEVADAGFSAFGERRHYTGSGPPTSANLTSIRGATRRGFTFQEHLDDVGLIHMNGRVYDPVIARFISADPFVQDPFNSQSLNRYSYVLNNPLRYTDPSGYFGWDSIGNFFNGLGRAIGVIRLWRDLWRTPPSCSGSCDWTTNSGGGSNEYSEGVFSPIIRPSPPGAAPAPPSSPPTFVRPANPALPPADTAVWGIGQPADAVNAQPAASENVCQSIGYMVCIIVTQDRASAIADQQARAGVIGASVVLPGAALEAVVAARTAQVIQVAATTTRSAAWYLPAFVRGRIIERALGMNLPGNFPTIDRFAQGIATSIKSLDLAAPSYQNIATLTRTLSGYVDELAKFSGRTWGGVSVPGASIVGRELVLAIPGSAMTAAQQAALQAIVQDAARIGVTVVIKVF